jgi:hypothetical protein
MQRRSPTVNTPTEHDLVVLRAQVGDWTAGSRATTVSVTKRRGPGRALHSRAELLVLRARATVPEHGREGSAAISARA